MVAKYRQQSSAKGLVENFRDELTKEQQLIQILNQMTDDNQDDWPKIRDQALALLD